MNCPGYEKKEWWSSTCRWFESGKVGWFGSSSFCNHSESKTGVCLTDGKEPEN